MTFTVTRILRLLEKKMEGPDSYTIHGSQSHPRASIMIRRRRGHG
jgi:putative lysine transport system permease protein